MYQLVEKKYFYKKLIILPHTFLSQGASGGFNV